MSLFRRHRSAASLRSPRRKMRRRPVGTAFRFEMLEDRRMMARDFLESEPLNDSSPGQVVQHHASATAVVDSRSVGASITNGDNDYYQFVASVNGDIVLSLANNGGDPSADLDGNVSLVLEQVTAGGVTIGSPVTLASNGATGSITIAGVSAGTTYYARIHGSTAADDANYTFEIANRDREDDAGGNNNRLGVATSLGSVGSFPAGVLNDYTITNGDRDFYAFTIPAGPSQTLSISVIMPAGTGAASGVDGPTNLGLRIRNAVGTILSSSNASSTSAVDTAVLNNASPGNYYVEVYSGSLGQVNRYDLSFITPLASLSGYKWNDLNGDGMRQDHEPGLQGVTINLDLGNNGSTDLTDVTDVNGFYNFANVPYGTHRLTETVPGGYTPTWPDALDSFQYVVVLDPLNNNLDHLDFGNYQGALVSGTKFNDLDADGQARELGEPGLQNWRIYVDYDNDSTWDNPTEPSALTDANGNYTIAGVLAGTYNVREVLQGGWTNSYPVGGAIPFTFSSGSVFTGADFGNWTTGTVSGLKFEDLDADGLNREGGDPTLPGWTIYVDYDNDSTLDAGEPFAVTDGSGNYTINGINPGTWTVRETGSPFFTNSYPAGGTYSVTFQSSGAVTGRDFGNWNTASISGVKYEDLDGDGVVGEPGEPTLNGWTIFVDYDNDSIQDAGEPWAITAGAGNYLITGVIPGNWNLREVLQLGWTQSTPSGSGAYAVAVPSNAGLTGYNFGNWRPSSISGTKYRDLDGDGTYPTELGDTPLAGFTIFVDYNNDGLLSGGEPSAVSNGAGTYTINGVAPGTWRVREQVLPGYNNTYPASFDAFGRYHSVIVTSNSSTSDIDFLNYEIISISGQKFADLSNVGVKDPTDPGLDGWLIQLYQDVNNNGVLEPNQYVGGQLVSTGADGAPVYTTTTSGNGAFELGGYAGFLAGQRYFVREVNQQGFQQTFGGTYAFIYANASVNNLNFGNAPCNGDTWNISSNYTTTYQATRVGILTVQLEGGGGGTLSVVKQGGGNFRYYTGAGTSVVGATAAGIADPYGAGLRVDLLVDVGEANTKYDITVNGAAAGAKLRIINSVNVDVQSTLGLQITTNGCGDFVGVYDDANFPVTSDAKRIFVGAVLGNLNTNTPLKFEGVQYNAQFINALYDSNPSISKIDITTNSGNDIVRVGDAVTQQVAAQLGDGDDLMRAGSGKATVYAGNGNDGVVGGVADDTIYGQNNNDILVGLNGSDRIAGEGGNDWISGGLGNDTWLRGGDGNDQLSGGSGIDALYGESGTDIGYRDAADAIVSTIEAPVLVVAPPDAVETIGNQLVDNVFEDHFVADGDNDGTLDTIDELMASLLP